MLDYRLYTFLKVAEMKNMTKAAENLGITQPGVTQHIKALEKRHGIKLFRAIGKELNLTDEGQIFLEGAKDMLKIKNKVLNRITTSSKKVFIGASLTIGGYLFPNIIIDYQEKHRDKEFILYVENTSNIIKKLYDGKINFAIVEGPFDKSRIKHSKLKEDELFFTVSSKSRYAEKKEISIDEVLVSNLILREEGSGTRSIFESKLKEKGYSLDNIHMEIGDITAIGTMVAANLGTTIISSIGLKDKLKNGDLINIPIKEFRIMREFNFIYLEDEESEVMEDLYLFSKEYLDIK